VPIQLSRRGVILGVGVAAALPAAAAPARHGAAAKASAAPAEAHPADAHPAAAHPVGLDPETAMQRLVDGNARYVAGVATHKNLDSARRTAVAAGQQPFAVILACADSRVAPEIIFDQGLGDLFVVRVAGNVVDDSVLASIEYAVIHLGSTLVMTLGHERCGAVKATVEALAGRGDDADRDTKIGALAALIAPAVKAVPIAAIDKVDAAVSLNAANAAAEIFIKSPPMRQRVMAGELKIVAARYDLDDGRVTPTKGQMPA
jgi:carbonic anhydrase